MRRYIVLAANTGLSPSDRPRIIKELRSNGYNVIDVRVGSNHVEVDMFSDQPPRLEELDVLEVVPTGVELDESPEACFSRAVGLFDSERFWEAHEALESLWRSSDGGVKVFLHGLILTAAAFVHLQKGDTKGFDSIIKRAVDELARAGVEFGGLDSRSLAEVVKKARLDRKPFKLSGLLN
ncbi:MAG: DUF309 domain-containing protein [Candidatus Caldarchaeum sp.]